MILIIDYDMGNIASIKNMIKRISCDNVVISSDARDFAVADKLILPGVGAFDQGIRNLKERGLVEAIKEAVLGDFKPILGICLGMQLLGDSSEEGQMKGLGLIEFDSVRFNLPEEYKIPHMGWNIVSIVQENNPLLVGLEKDDLRFYFVHSYHAVCKYQGDELMRSNYGYDFTAAVSHKNIYGVQFHPEKSHRFGMKLLENYIRL